MLLGGELQIDAKNSNFEIFWNAPYMKSWSMHLIENIGTHQFGVLPESIKGTIGFS